MNLCWKRQKNHPTVLTKNDVVENSFFLVIIYQKLFRYRCQWLRGYMDTSTYFKWTSRRSLDKDNLVSLSVPHDKFKENTINCVRKWHFLFSFIWYDCCHRCDCCPVRGTESIVYKFTAYFFINWNTKYFLSWSSKAGDIFVFLLTNWEIPDRYYNMWTKFIWFNGGGFIKIVDYIPGKLPAKIDNIVKEKKHSIHCLQNETIFCDPSFHNLCN